MLGGVKSGEWTPAKLTDIVKASGLRGRGGAGFPCGMKWTFVPPKEKRGDKPVYLLCNADESEPGTFKDRLLIEKDPHQILEGMMLASFALEVKHAYIYIRGEMVHGAEILNAAVAEAYAKGFLGTDILGSGVDLDITVHRGAGAYICGEETALIESLEGKRGHPRIKPPFPAVSGVWGCPTVVNNVETLCCVKHIVDRGADWFKSIGRNEKNTGPKLYCVSGHVEKPGVYEAPDRHPVGDAPRDGRRRPRRAEAQGRHPRRRVGADAHGGRDRGHPDGLRRRRGREVDARLGRDHRDGRDDGHPEGRHEHREVLRARVLRAVHALPRGHALDAQDAQAAS